MGLLRDRLLARSLLALFALQFAVLGTTVYLVLFLQHSLGTTVVTAGLVLAVAGVFTPLLSRRTGARADRRGVRALVVGGQALATVGLTWTALAATTLSLAWLLPGLLLFGLARPAVSTPAGVGPFVTLTSRHRAFAASLVTEARRLGAVLGVATLGMAYTVVGVQIRTRVPRRWQPDSVPPC